MDDQQSLAHSLIKLVESNTTANADVSLTEERDVSSRVLVKLIASKSVRSQQEDAENASARISDELVNEAHTVLLTMLLTLRNANAAEEGLKAFHALKKLMPMLERLFTTTNETFQRLRSPADAVAAVVDPSLSDVPVVSTLRTALRTRVIEPCLEVAKEVYPYDAGNLLVELRL